MAMFKAFKPSGMEKIARSMGYQGNMQGFQDYVSQDPMRQQQMQNYTNQAMQMAKGGVARKMREGGVAAGGVNPLTGTATTQAGPQQYQSAIPSIPPMYGPEGTYSLTGQPSQDLSSRITPQQIADAQKFTAAGGVPQMPDYRDASQYKSGMEDRRPSDLPDYQAFKDWAAKNTKPEMSSQVMVTKIGPDGKAINFSNPVEARNYDNYLKSIGKEPLKNAAGPAQLTSLVSADGTIATPGAPADYSGMTYEQALTRQGQRDVKSPEEQAVINAALKRGPTGQQQPVPIATPPQPTTYDPLGQYRPNVDMYTETGAFKNPQIQSTHETLKGVYEKTDATPQEKSNATLDYLRNIYTGPMYNSEAGATGLGSNQFTQEFAQFANAMGIEIDNSLAATDGPQLVNIPEGNPTLTQAGWMPQAPAEQPGIGQFSVDQMYAPGLPPGGVTVAAKTDVEPGQFIQPGTGQVSGDVSVPTATAATSTADPVQAKDANTMSAVQAAPAVDNALNATAAAQADPSNPNAQVTAAQQTASSVGNLQAAQGNATLINNPVQRQIQSGEIITGTGVDAQAAAQLTAQTQAAAATANPSQQAMVQNQLSGLMQQFQSGQPPAWAAGAMRAATAQMAARGLASSSLAGQAVVQAAMESAMPIAMADAQTVATFEAQNLSNRQQASMLAAEQRAKFMGQDFDQAFQTKVLNASRIADIANLNFTAEQQVQLENSRAANTMNLANLSNTQGLIMAEAAALAQLDTSNLNNRQQAAVQNAQNFLQYDMANLSNRQQTELFKAQQRVQALFTDQAATNAARQFNATSQNQTDQFFANLSSQVSQFNASQQNAQSQFNAGQTNTVNRFNAELNNQRDQFNATNQLVIAQSNAQWRRQIATADTAAINRANELNANAVLDISKNAYDNLWTFYGDSMEWAWKSAEKQIDRMNALAIAELDATTRQQIADEQAKTAAGNAIGSLISTVVGSYFFGMCWVAREVYGKQDVRWLIFRTWLKYEAPKWLNKLYEKHGEKFAEFISNKPALKWVVRNLMDKVVASKKPLTFTTEYVKLMNTKEV
jgi:hypothetical protein